MPVTSTHPLYDLRAPAWQRCREVAAGTDAVKAARTRYLPMLGGQTLLGYEGYVIRAMFYPAVERTIGGLTGLVLRKPPTVEVPKEVEAHLVDLTLTGQPWESFLLDLIDECLTVGRVGVLVEWPATEAGTRPYWTRYQAEAIVSWTTGSVLGPDGETREGLTRVVLAETVEVPDPKDPFVAGLLVQYRVLELLGGVYTVTLWQKTETDKWVAGEPIVPLRRGQPVPAIPFIPIGSKHVAIEPDKPPLLDLVDVNLSHYRSSADLEWGRHWTALPTPWVTGYNGSEPLTIGSSVAWTLASDTAKVGMLEFTGQGLGALERALEHKEKLMAILGARLLEGEPRTNETAEAVRLRHAGDVATLGTICYALDEGLTLACRWHAWWLGDDAAFTDEALVRVALNRDFFGTPMPPEAAKVLLAMWQAGAIAYATYYDLLQRGDWTRTGVTVEEEQADLAKEEAALPPEPAPAPFPPPEAAVVPPPAEPPA